MWIELPQPENSANTCAWLTETPDSCFDLIRSHQQCYTVISPTGDRTSDHRMHSRNSTTEPSAQVTSNQLVRVIARLINLNVSCKLHPYSLQRTRSPPGPRLPRRIGNTYPRNYYKRMGKDIDEHLIFLVGELYCELFTEDTVTSRGHVFPGGLEIHKEYDFETEIVPLASKTLKSHIWD